MIYHSRVGRTHRYTRCSPCIIPATVHNPRIYILKIIFRSGVLTLYWNSGPVLKSCQGAYLSNGIYLRQDTPEWRNYLRICASALVDVMKAMMDRMYWIVHVLKTPGAYCCVLSLECLTVYLLVHRCSTYPACYIVLPRPGYHNLLELIREVTVPRSG